MIALDQALHAKLAAGTAVTSQLAAGTAGIYYRQAEDAAVAPLLVYYEVTGTPSYTLGARAWEDYVYVVKAITEGPSFAQAKTIRDAVDAMLSDASLTVSGRDHLYLRRIGSLEYAENVDGRRFNHAGGEYRVWIA